MDKKIVLWRENHQANNHFLAFIWINYTDLNWITHFFSLHQAYSFRIQCRKQTKQEQKKKKNKQTPPPKKTTKNKKTIQRQSCAAHNPSCHIASGLDTIYTSIEYVYTSVTITKIRYVTVDARLHTHTHAHTRWKQNTKKLYSPHWGQRYTRLFKKWTTKRRKNLLRLKKKRINTSLKLYR